jgi:hypothetical protein
MAQFVQNAAAQIELASNFVLAELKTMPERIKTGDAPMPREPVSEPVMVVVPPPPTQTVWMLRTAKFRDHAGLVQFARQFDDAEMPMETAQRALHRGVAVSVSDPRRRDLRGARGGDPVDPRAPDIVDLDDDEATGPAHIEPMVVVDPAPAAANFRVIDRSSENRAIKVAGPQF